jgi:hypothetical protein
MNMDSIASCTQGVLHAALMSGLGNVAEDRGLCFISDRIHRACPHCGTIFIGSAWRMALPGPQSCPFCGWTDTAPVTSRTGVA